MHFYRLLAMLDLQECLVEYTLKECNKWKKLVFNHKILKNTKLFIKKKKIKYFIKGSLPVLIPMCFYIFYISLFTKIY